VLDAYAAAGGDFVDTADSYTWRVEGNSGGDSERVLGDWMAVRGVRDRMVVATKVGSWPERPGLSPENVRAACDDSLRRLRTDHIDLYYAHRDDPDTPIEDTLGAFDELVHAGKIRHVGLSNYSAERLTSVLTVAEQHGLVRPVALQPHYNLVERAGYEDELAEVASSADLGVMPYFALAKGFLTGKYRPGDAPPDTSGPMASARAGGAVAYLDDRGARVLAALDEVAAAHAAPVAAVALAWLAAQPTVTAPIASARSVDQLGTILPMAELTLADDELAALTQASEDTRLDA
jgi:aryl-alcohol dehydrogenase (NADP+)